MKRVGICVSNDKPCLRGIIEQRLQSYPGDTTILKFYIEDLNIERRYVKGECLEKKGGRVTKRNGIFPFPDVIYMQCQIDLDVLKKIESVMASKIFNNFIFDKLQCFDLFANHNLLSTHLPATQKLENEQDLLHFLFHYRDIFLKPISASFGHSSYGIYRVRLQHPNEIVIFYRSGNQSVRQQFSSYGEFWSWLSPQISIHPYIKQRSIQTFKFGEMANDIRLNMNKNSKGEWQVSALFLRIANNPSHIITGHSTVCLFNDLKKIYPGHQKWDEIEKSVVELGFKICRVFDEYGYHMGDLGIDLGVDEDGHVWIFEVNPLPYPFGFNTPFQDYSWFKPIEYALFLASK